MDSFPSSFSCEVGLKSCQEMIDCADTIWMAGESYQNKSPNPYAFTPSSKQGLTDINPVKDARWDDVNSGNKWYV